MQTQFTPAQLADPTTAAAAGIIRKCVHCGFCTATCPTFLLTGDELDSPRGRIWLIKDMLEAGGPPSPAAVHHVDRCLGCLSCVTTCPSGVDYRQLVDTARAHIAAHHTRPWPDRAVRRLLSLVLTRPALFGVATRLGRLARPLAGMLPKPVAAMLDAVPDAAPVEAAVRAGVFPAVRARQGRVALHAGCVQPVLRPGIDAAAIRLLNRHGVEVVVAATGVCCGALDHHMGLAGRAKALAQANITAWEAQLAAGEIDAILVTTSGCGTVVKHYDELFGDDPAWHARAGRIAALTRDVSEYLATLTLVPVLAPDVAVAWHAACSLQHGQQIRDQPRALLTSCGFDVREIGEGHICCGSAGTYSILQPEMAQALKRRKQAAIAATGAPVMVSGNIGCLEHLASAETPTLHLVELLDWATGGPRPPGLPSPEA